MQAISHWVITFVVNSTWQGVIIVIAASVSALALRRAPARYQHLLWVTALLLSIAVPLIGTARSLNRASVSPASASIDETQNSTAVLSGATLWLRGRLTGSPAGKPTIPVAPAVGLVLAGLYAVFVLYRAGGFLQAYWKTKTIRHIASKRRTSGGVAPGIFGETVDRCRAALGVAAVRVLAASDIAAPLTLAAIQPTIIVPQTLGETASPEMLTTMIGHEMAHIKRRDFLFNLIYEVLLMPVSFSPAMILIKRGLARTREMACDEMVTERLLKPITYARSLLAIASYAVATGNAGYCLGVFDANNLEERIMKLTDKNRRVSSRSGKLAAAAGILLLAGCGLIASGFCLGIGAAGRQTTARDQHQGDAAFPAGTYQDNAIHTIDGKQFKTSFIVTFEPEGRFSARLTDAPGEVKAQGTYVVDHNQFVITEGHHADEDLPCSKPGKYTWSYDGKNLSFKKVEDDCEGRVRALTSGPLSPYVPDK
jgi:beta-lactamase regulating signal transducer with metallopeptidase domain